jgi:hypothetical protein
MRRAALQAAVFGATFLVTYGLVGLAGGVSIESARHQARDARLRAESAVHYASTLTNKVQFATSPASIGRFASSRMMIDGQAIDNLPARQLPSRGLTPSHVRMPEQRFGDGLVAQR